MKIFNYFKQLFSEDCAISHLMPLFLTGSYMLIGSIILGLLYDVAPISFLKIFSVFFLSSSFIFFFIATIIHLGRFIAQEPFKTKNNTHLKNELLLTKQTYLTELEKETEQ